MPDKDKACHTCRRRRVKCDRALPHCKRCEAADLECLGYGKLILWNQGVASRGKMMGKTFELPPEYHDHDAKRRAISRSKSPSERTVIIVPTAPSTPSPAPLQVSSLVDPLFQDFSAATRRYLSHFGVHFSKELVIYDVPDQNPVRQLLRYARDHPVLRHIIIATSAHHLYNLCPADQANRGAIYHDALVAEHKAIRLLNDALANMGKFDVNIMLAAVMLFIYVDFIEFGERNWRIHLEGAKSLVRYVKTHAGGNLVDCSVRRWLVSEIFVLDVMGSTLGSAWSLEPSIYGIEEGIDIESILAMLEVNNFVSCPAELLKHMLTLTQRPHGSSEPTTAAQISATLHSVHAFDPLKWASTIQKRSPCKDLNERIQIASAYQAATCLYVSRMLPPDHTDTYTSEDRQNLVSSVIQHISQFHPDNGLFKSTMWPCFIAGAEAEHPQQREWVMSHMQMIYHVFPYKSYKKTMEALEMIWRQEMDDSAVAGGEREDWLHMIKRLGVDLWVA